MRKVTLEKILSHNISQKYLYRSGIVHAVAVAYHAFHIAKEKGIDVDKATKAGFLHDMGHFTWYQDGKWDYELYKQNDIHAIKGAERAHKLLIRLGEEHKKAKEISLAILFHTDSCLPEGEIKRTELQETIKLADEKDEESGGWHHYRTLSPDRVLKSIQRLDQMVEEHLHNQREKSE